MASKLASKVGVVGRADKGVRQVPFVPLSTKLATKLVQASVRCLIRNPRQALGDNCGGFHPNLPWSLTGREVTARDWDAEEAVISSH